MVKRLRLKKSVRKPQKGGNNGFLRPPTFHQDASMPGALSGARFYPNESVLSPDQIIGQSARNVPMNSNGTGNTTLKGGRRTKTYKKGGTKRGRTKRRRRGQKGGGVLSTVSTGGLSDMMSAFNAGSKTGLFSPSTDLAAPASSQFPLTDTVSNALAGKGFTGNTTNGSPVQNIPIPTNI